MNLPQVYMCSPSWLRIPPPSLYHPSGSSQCTGPKHPVSCIKPGLAIPFIYDIIHVSMPLPQIIPASPSPTESKRPFCTSVFHLLSHIQCYYYHLSKFHIYALVYCIGVFLFSMERGGNARVKLCVHLFWDSLSSSGFHVLLSTCPSNQLENWVSLGLTS